MSNMYIKHFQRVPVIFILETYSKEVSDETCTRIFLFFFFFKKHRFQLFFFSVTTDEVDINMYKNSTQ